MSVRRVLPLVLLYSAVVFPQKTDTLNETIFKSSPELGCPVEMKAKLEGHSKLVPVGMDGQGSDGERLHLTLKNPSSIGIEAAVVEVHGYQTGVRLSPTVLRTPDPDEIKQNFPIAGTIAPGDNTSFELSLKGLGTLTHIDVESLAYADGSIWQTAVQHLCRAFGKAPIEAVVITNPR